MTRPMPISFDARMALVLLRKVLFRAQGGRCGICGWPVRNFKAASIEHVVPRSLGGFWGLGNMVAAHRDCNQAKGDRLPTGCELIWLLAVNARLDVQPQRWAA